VFDHSVCQADNSSNIEASDIRVIKSTIYLLTAPFGLVSVKNIDKFRRQIRSWPMRNPEHAP
jgi:hypothetical protein